MQNGGVWLLEFVQPLPLNSEKAVFTAGKSYFFSVHEQYVQSELACELLPYPSSALEFVFPFPLSFPSL